IVVDDRHLAKRADPAIGIAVELTAGLIQRVDSIRQPGLLERPLRPKVFRLTDSLGKDASEAIERDHVVSSTFIGATNEAGPDRQAEQTFFGAKNSKRNRR